MTDESTRRKFLSSFAAVAIAGLAGCSNEPDLPPEPTRTPTPEITSTPEPTEEKTDAVDEFLSEYRKIKSSMDKALVVVSEGMNDIRNRRFETGEQKLSAAQSDLSNALYRRNSEAFKNLVKEVRPESEENQFNSLLEKLDRVLSGINKTIALAIQGNNARKDGNREEYLSKFDEAESLVSFYEEYGEPDPSEFREVLR